MRSLIAFLSIFLVLLGARGQDNPVGIPVVKTFKDLQASRAIDVGNGVKVRLGLEANKIPRWSGALLYCLAENYVPTAGGEGKAPFGPVHAEFNFENERAEAALMSWKSSRKSPKGTYLFVRALPIDRIGTYHVTVTDRQGKLLARAVVEGTKEFFHPWMPWLQGLNKPVSPWEGIALPKLSSLAPVAKVDPKKEGAERLPTLLPSEEKPKLTIKKDGNGIVIKADSDFTTSRPDYHFLARWWVNGKPFVPKQIDKDWAFAGYGRVSEDKEMRVEFNLCPERLGAKAGDKIGLQLMHAEGQWAWCAGSSFDQAAAARKDGENVRISNRIEFVVPKK